MPKQKYIAILGATGSIGTQTLDVIAQTQTYQIELLAANGTNIEAIKKQCEKFNPKYYLINNNEALQQLQQTNLSETQFLPLSQLASLPLKSEVGVAAISGFSGIQTTLEIIPKIKTLAIANKEAILCAWQSIWESCQRHNCNILPLDSEHNAINSVMQYIDSKHIEYVTITASGGSLLGKNKQNVTIDQALNHPNWSMGVKNTIDSATLVNKGMEYIEACNLFNLSAKQVRAVIHRQSLVHGEIKMRNGLSFLIAAQPDMRVHINQAINGYGPWDSQMQLETIPQMTFEEIDKNEFPGFYLAKTALEQGTSSIIAFTVANEANVNAFVNGQIKFTDIVENTKKTMLSMPSVPINNTAAIMQHVSNSYSKALTIINSQTI